MDIYYKIWVDCIVRMKAQKKNKDTWRRDCKIWMNVPMIANLFTVMGILQRYVFGPVYTIRFSSLSLEVNSIISFCILYLFPVILVNYLLIWRKDKYKKLIEKYHYNNGKLAAIYACVSFFLIPIWLFGIAFNIIP